jgi:hypothetical protein
MEKVYVKKGALIKQVSKDVAKSFLQDGYKLVEMSGGEVTVKNPIADELQKLKAELEALKKENKALTEKLAKKTTKAQE